MIGNNIPHYRHSLSSLHSTRLHLCNRTRCNTVTSSSPGLSQFHTGSLLDNFTPQIYLTILIYLPCIILTHFPFQQPSFSLSLTGAIIWTCSQLEWVPRSPSIEDNNYAYPDVLIITGTKYRKSKCYIERSKPFLINEGQVASAATTSSGSNSVKHWARNSISNAEHNSKLRNNSRPFRHRLPLGNTSLQNSTHANITNYTAC